MIMPMMPVDRAAITEPSIITASSTSTMRRLPYMSPRRPAIGVVTAAASSVEVTTQAVSSRDFILPDGTPLARTCSIGFACYPFLPSHPRLMSWSQVVELADVGLYISKHSGRDAWTAVLATAAAQPAELFARLVHQLDQCVESGEARIVTSLGERTIITP